MSATEPVRREIIGLYGGSFDPVHAGHIALVRSAEVALRLTQVRLIPSAVSWQKPGQRTPAEHRRNMLQAAIAAWPHWRVDNIEIDRGGASYTIDTLESLRADLGPQVALVLLMGSDQLHNLATWHRYEDILSFAHIAVTQRERVGLSNFPAPVEALVQKHGRDALSDQPAGSLVFFRMPAVPVSSTKLRQSLANGEPVNDLLPQPVLDYIRTHHLYCGAN